jgi:hypothetical protein
VTLLDPGPVALEAMTLDDLAAEARVEYAHTSAHLTGALAHFIRLGEILHVARQRVEPGTWIVWLRSVGIDNHFTADRAIRLAVYRDHLPPEALQVRRDGAGRVRNPSWNNALTYLRGLPPVGPKGNRGYDETIKREAARLRKKGLSYRQISEALNVGETTVRSWLDTDFRRRKKLANKRARDKITKDATAARRARRREERDGLAREASTELADAYGNLRKALAALDRAIGASTDVSVVGAARRSMGQMHSAENSLIEAIRAERVVKP